jgi:hypothetical protein
VHEERDIAVMFSQHRVDWVGVCVDVARHVANSDGFCGGRSLVLWFSEVPFIEVAGYPAAFFGQVVVYAWAFAVWVPPLYFTALSMK